MQSAVSTEGLSTPGSCGYFIPVMIYNSCYLPSSSGGCPHSPFLSLRSAACVSLETFISLRLSQKVCGDVTVSISKFFRLPAQAPLSSFS